MGLTMKGAPYSRVIIKGLEVGPKGFRHRAFLRTWRLCSGFVFWMPAWLASKTEIVKLEAVCANHRFVSRLRDYLNPHYKYLTSTESLSALHIRIEHPSMDLPFWHEDHERFQQSQCFYAATMDCPNKTFGRNGLETPKQLCCWSYWDSSWRLHKEYVVYWDMSWFWGWVLGE